ncbi:hypothetical protein [Cesiribacter andamanensis]|uniref:Peptidase C39-like domain-containing protein n=1 Tax=Cesiribacter andamanensis AMV16 TaxID=1279009 RepID=M7NC27_9BACT|nr:hypothetical protein [Cesiribacter andamanensis]EMR04772.1 hypothetical protein ADICEAN_00043 [Cesiribacter andamanensis AMV16]
MKAGFILLLLFCFYGAQAQQANKNWQQDLNKHLEQFMACEQGSAPGINPCNRFIGGALPAIYNINDFYSAALGRHMLVSEIAAYLNSTSSWRMLGRGYDQKALSQAQELANAGKAVIAIYLNAEGIGHVSYIVPGELKLSGTWGFRVPNSASFFITDPQRSYVGKSLSYAYERPLLNGVLLYTRNY